MKVAELMESAEDVKTYPAVRVLKFSSKDGSNDFDVDLKNTPCHVYLYSYATNGRPDVFIAKPNTCKIGDKVHIVKNDKPNIQAASNYKVDEPKIIIGEFKTFDEFLAKYPKLNKEMRGLKITIDARLATSTRKVKPVETVEEPEDGYFILGY